MINCQSGRGISKRPAGKPNSFRFGPRFGCRSLPEALMHRSAILETDNSSMGVMAISSAMSDCNPRFSFSF